MIQPMTKRERSISAIKHQQPDKVPYFIGFTKKAHERMAEYYDDPDFEERLGNCLRLLTISSKKGWEEVAPDVWQDEFGVQWDRRVDKDVGVVCNQAINKGNLDAYRFPDPCDPLRFAGWDEAIAKHQDTFFVGRLSFSLFERAWTLAGMENILMSMAVDRDFVETLFDRILEHNLHVIDLACSFDIDAMYFGDDWGFQTGLLMGAMRWRELIKPRISQMYRRVKSKGKLVVIHSCGKVQELFPDLIECGLDVFNPFQPEVMDVFEMKKRYGNELCFYGGISTQQTLPFGTVSQVKAEVRRLLDVVGENGGYIAAPAHAIPGDAKAENIAAMIETLQNQ